MKKISIIFLSTSLLFTLVTAEAQIEVVPEGPVKIGADNFDPDTKDFTVLDVHHNTVTNYDAHISMRMDNVNNYLQLNRRGYNYRNEIIWYSANSDYWHMGMNDADNTGNSSINSLYVGKNIGGTNPFIWLDNSRNNIGLFTTNPDINYELTLNGNALAYGGIWQSSDIDLKQNINRIESSLEKLLSIRGVTYEYNSEYEKLVSPELVENKEINYVDSTGAILNQQTEQSNPISKNKYGVIAQEVMEQFPDLVHKGSNGYYAVNYDGLIPVLIEAIKEQQTIVKNIQNELNAIKQSSLKGLTSVTDTDETVDSPKLYQNSPNPFEENTAIRYYLPESVVDAHIIIYDMTGKQLRRISLNEDGDSNIEVHGGELDPGIYIYCMMVERKLVDTKQMILTD